MITIVSATRYSEEEFWRKSALGTSLSRIAYDTRINARINAKNTLPLSVIYNYSIEAADQDDILVFIHDDVWIDDYYFGDRVIEGLKHFDVIGVAGNKRRIAHQPSWLFKTLQFEEEAKEYLAGSLSHGLSPGAAASVSHYGDSPASCELLDGVMLASTRAKLHESQVRFDPQFDFHFYDLDFCRTARTKQLKLGTWPVVLTHQSQGSFGSPRWQEMYQLYQQKWGD